MLLFHKLFFILFQSYVLFVSSIPDIFIIFFISFLIFLKLLFVKLLIIQSPIILLSNIGLFTSIILIFTSFSIIPFIYPSNNILSSFSFLSISFLSPLLLIQVLSSFNTIVPFLFIYSYNHTNILSHFSVIDVFFILPALIFFLFFCFFTSCFLLCLQFFLLLSFLNLFRISFILSISPFSFLYNSNSSSILLHSFIVFSYKFIHSSSSIFIISLFFLYNSCTSSTSFFNNIIFLYSSYNFLTFSSSIFNLSITDSSKSTPPISWCNISFLSFSDNIPICPYFNNFILLSNNPFIFSINNNTISLIVSCFLHFNNTICNSLPVFS
uniref:Uncharacterized protein n=1 Tax=Conidiobolus sp. TaxID=1973308 RepID=A0A649UAQ5_9FUNG|nr:hypothetical protein [Conidiobolus sp.]